MNTETPANEQIPDCVKEYVWYVQYCCEGDVYNRKGHKQPSPCQYMAKIGNPPNDHEWFTMCPHSQCALYGSTDGFSNDCDHHDEW